jgi:hypothetical protein
VNEPIEQKSEPEPDNGKLFQKIKNQDGTTEWKYNKQNWKSAFKMDWASISMIIVLIILAWSYNHDMAMCKDVVISPCDYCAINGVQVSKYAERTQQSYGYYNASNFNNSMNLSFID